MAKRRLTKQQKRRIDDNIARRQQQDSPLDSAREGLIIAHHGKQLLVEDETGRTIPCHARQNIGAPVCGDRVSWQQPAGHEEGVVTAILPRISLLQRPGFADKLKPVAANISLICVVIAPKPEPQETLIDRYLVAAEQLNIQPLLIHNKIDLLDGNELNAWRDRFNIYHELGYQQIETSCEIKNKINELKTALSDHNSILVGQSGVGKSSLINQLIPDIALSVSKLSEQINQGQHTTSHSQLFHLPESSGNIIDSPGVRDFRLGHLQQEEIALGFREFRPLLGHCRFSNCTHKQEPGCALLNAVDKNQISPARLQSYFEIISN